MTGFMDMVLHGWAKKITKTQEEKNFKDTIHPLRHQHIYGTDKVVFVNNQRFIQHAPIPHYEGRRETHSNAQQFARELTILEKLLCRIYLKRQEAIEKGLIKIKSQDDN